MDLSATSSPAHCRSRWSRRSRRGFTFAEVMFAVILLGIGFIMLAGMFPVAIQQTQVSQEETYAANIAQSAKRYLEEVAYETDFPSTAVPNSSIGVLHVIPDSNINDPWNRLAANVINAQDKRFAWTALYRRNPGDNVMQVVIIALQSRNTPVFEYPRDTDPSGGNLPANLTPVRVQIQSLTNANSSNNFDADRVVFAGDMGQLPNTKLVSGTFLILNSLKGPQIYRLGNQRGDIDSSGHTWDLAPGFDMADDTENLGAGALAFIVGRGYEYPAPAVAGPAMDIGAYVTFIRLK